jgi:hypothetical protein
LKLAFKAYYDEVETANPLGYARGAHSIGCIYVSILNLPPEMRNRLEYTFPVTLVLNTSVKRHGMAACLAGAKVGSDGKLEPDPTALTSLGAQLRLLDSGVAFQVPCASTGYADLYVHAWLVIMSADYPAAGKMLPTAESTAAHHPCRHCLWERKASNASQPGPFLAVSRPLWKPRTLKQASADRCF